MIKRYGRFSTFALDTAGNTGSGVSVAIYRQGAVADAHAAQASGSTWTLVTRGGLKNNDVVEVWRDNGTTQVKDSGATVSQFTCTVISNTSISLTWSGGTTLDIDLNDRIIPVSPDVDLYADCEGEVSATNPISTTASGEASAWLDGGTYYDYKISGSIGGTPLSTRCYFDHYVHRQRWVYLDDPKYNIDPTGFADSYTGLSQALQDGAGGVVVCHPGTDVYYATTNSLAISGGTVLRGWSSSNSARFQLFAGYAGGANGLFQIAGAGSRVENVIVDMQSSSDVPITIGLASTTRGAGLSNVHVEDFTGTGINVASSADGVSLDNVTIDANGAGSAVALHLNGCGAVALSHINVKSSRGGGTDLHGVLCEATAPVAINQLKAQNFANAVYVNQDGVSVFGAVSDSSTVDLVEIAAGKGYVSLFNLEAAGTNVVNDVARSITSTVTNMAYYLSGPPGASSVITDDPAVGWQIPNDVTVTGDITAATLTTTGDATIGGDLTVDGNLLSFGGWSSITVDAVTKDITTPFVRITGASTNLQALTWNGGSPADGQIVYLFNTGVNTNIGVNTTNANDIYTGTSINWNGTNGQGLVLVFDAGTGSGVWRPTRRSV